MFGSLQVFLHEATGRMMAGANPARTQQLLDRSIIRRRVSREEKGKPTGAGVDLPIAKLCFKLRINRKPVSQTQMHIKKSQWPKVFLPYKGRLKPVHRNHHTVCLLLCSLVLECYIVTFRDIRMKILSNQQLKSCHT